MRCKFRLDRAEMFMVDAPTGETDPATGREKFAMRMMHTLILHPVSADPADKEHENTRYWRDTPQGELRVQTVNAGHVAGLELNGEYYLDLTPA